MRAYLSRTSAPTPVLIRAANGFQIILGKVRPMLKVVQEAREPNVAGSVLDEIVRDGARQMLAAALQAEVAAYIDAHWDQVDVEGRRLVVRNGYHQPRRVTTAAGAVEVRQPRVN